MAYKGRIGTKETERHYPHIVELIVPLKGFGTRLNDMHVGTLLAVFRANEAEGVITKAVIMFDGALSVRKMRRRFSMSLAVS
jgi:hypothetical protein